MTTDPVSSLEAWYAGNCDGDWEHGWGVLIQTLDNPGWSIEINLEGTSLQGRVFTRVQADRSEDDWVRCWADENVFKGRGGPRNLGELLRIFAQWKDADSGGAPRQASRHSNE